MLNKEQATDFVIKELGKHRSQNEIIVALCEKTGANWAEAEKFLRQVEAQHGKTITARQSPILIIFGIGLLIVGLAITVNSSLYFVNYFQASHTAISVDEALGLRSFYLQLLSLLTGLGLIVGGLIGSWQTVSKLLQEG